MKIEIKDTRNEGASIRFGGALVRVSKIQNGAYRQFLIRWKIGRKTMRRVFAKRDKAIEEAQRIVTDLSSALGEKTTIHPEDNLFLRECLRKAGGKSRLLEAVEQYVAKNPIGAGRKTVKDFSEEFMAHMRERKEVKNLSRHYLNGLATEANSLRSWVGDRQFSDVTHDDFQAYVSRGDWAAFTYRNLVRHWQMMEKFAKKKGYLGKDAESITTDLALPPTNRRTVPFWEPWEMMHLLMIATPKEIPYLATMAFAGSRRAEFQRMTAGHLGFDTDHAVIDASIAKTPSRRVLDKTEQVKAWLSVAEIPDVGRLITERQVAAISRNKARLAAVGLTWKNNALRHSFSTYHLAKYRDANETSYLSGHSAKTLQRYYRGLVTTAQADEWFNITPIVVRAYAEENGLSSLIKW
jgi:site-specific recombinase XerD